MLDCVTQNVHSLQHTYMSSSYRFSRLSLSHWDSYAVHRHGCLELYYYNMVEWFQCDSSLISTTNWFPSVLWHCWFGHLACKNRPQMTYYVLSGTLNPTHSLSHALTATISVFYRFCLLDYLVMVKGHMLFCCCLIFFFTSRHCIFELTERPQKSTVGTQSELS